MSGLRLRPAHRSSGTTGERRPSTLCAYRESRPDPPERFSEDPLMTSRRTGALWLALTLSTAVSSLADEPPSSPAPASIEELDQRLRILERRREIDAEAGAGATKKAAEPKAGKDGFALRSTDGAFVLKLRGYVQLDGRFFRDDAARRATDTFVLRRVRPILEGTLWGNVDFRVMPDFGGGSTVLQDAYAELKVAPWLRVRAGKFKPPVGLERLQSGTDILFVERGEPTNLVPNRDLGVQAYGDVAQGLLTYQLGVFNGVPDGASADVDSDDGKDLAARLFVQPFLRSDSTALRGLGFGVSASHGAPRGSVASPGLPSYRSQGQQTYFTYRSDGTAAGTAFANGNRDRLSPQLSWLVGPVGLLAEQVRSEAVVQRGTARATLTQTAWQVETSWVLTGEPASFKAVKPRRTFEPAQHGWGAWEVKARVSELRVDRDAFPAFADPTRSARRASVLGVGVNWYLNPSARIALDAERTRFHGGALNGDRSPESILLTRIQVSF